ncbi:MAG: hypothetical protein GY925_13190 [Actinomycetia bacterium]|nr:hypothetical protein [Actinomycetes bacterium]
MQTPIHQLASTIGDGTGTTTATGDYTSTTTTLKITANATPLAIIRMIGTIKDSGAFDADKYGNNITITNGIRIYLRDTDDTTITEFTPLPIATNADWASMCHDLSIHSFGQGNQIATMRWTYGKYDPGGIRLNPGQSIALDFHDNYTGLVDHRFMFEGHTIDPASTEPHWT